MDEDFWDEDHWSDDDGSDNYTIKYNELKYATDEAYLLKIGKKDYWFPKSQVVLDEASFEITLSYWLLEAKELEDMVDFE